MQRRGSQDPSYSRSNSPLSSPTEERDDSIRRNSTVAFVPFDAGSSSGISSETRRQVRVQAAKASAAARKRTIARKLALQQSASVDEGSGSASIIEHDQLRGQFASPSPIETGTFQAVAPPGLGRSGSAPQLEPFRPYPVTQWHPQIPALVDHFLRYFAPALNVDMGGREALRAYLWPEALGETALFHAILLVAGSHANVSNALAVPIQLLYQLKHSTIQSVNDAIAGSEARGGIKDSVIAAIALLGGWELEYGDATTYDTHMRGLETVVNLRGGSSDVQSAGSEAPPLPPPVASIILAAGHDSALYAGRPARFAHHNALVSAYSRVLPSTLPAGFEALRGQRLLLPDLMHLVSRLEVLTPSDPALLLRCGDIQQSLATWDLANITRASYSPFQTYGEDSLKRQICAHVRVAGLSMCIYARLTASMGTPESLGHLYHESLQLHPEILIGSVYDELCFWSLFMICTTTGRCEARHMRAMKRLQLDLGMGTWAQCKDILARFVYNAALLDGRGYALWEAVLNSTIARDLILGLGQPSRFAKGVPHPTTYIGRAIVEEEG